jgi:hypothetical protein
MKAIEDIDLELIYINNPKGTYTREQKNKLTRIVRLSPAPKKAAAASASASASAAPKAPRRTRRNSAAAASKAPTRTRRNSAAAAAPKAPRRTPRRTPTRTRRNMPASATSVSSTKRSVSQPNGITIQSVLNVGNEFGLDNLAGEYVPPHNNLPNSIKKGPSKAPSKGFFSRIVGSKKKGSKKKGSKKKGSKKKGSKKKGGKNKK